MNNCSENAQELLVRLRQARAAIDNAILAAERSIADDATSIQSGDVVVSQMPALKKRVLQNGTTFSLIHGNLEYASTQVWRDDTTNLAWSPMATIEELNRMHRRTPSVFVGSDGTEYIDRSFLARVYCQSLVIPGMEGVKWTLPEVVDFLMAAGNSAQHIENRTNKALLEALPGMKNRWFWSSSSSPSNPHMALYFSSYGGNIGSSTRSDENSVRCVSLRGR